MEKIPPNSIVLEGVLLVRSNRGIAGMRRWITRYFVLCKHDGSLRRYKSAEEVDDKDAKPPRIYLLKEIDACKPVSLSAPA